MEGSGAPESEGNHDPGIVNIILLDLIFYICLFMIISMKKRQNALFTLSFYDDCIDMFA